MFESLEGRQFMSVSMTSLTTKPAASLPPQPTAAETLTPEQKTQLANILSSAGGFWGEVSKVIDPTATPQQQAGGK